MNTSTLAVHLLSIAAATFLTAQSSGETHFVNVDGSGFSPSVLNINVGDTVVWVNNDEFFPHTTTSDLSLLDPDYWNGSLFDFEETFEKTFNNPGMFTYHDGGDTGTGTIVVIAVPEPIITLSLPRFDDEEEEALIDVEGLTIGKTSHLEFSTNLIEWIPIATNIALTSSITFTNAIRPGPNHFRVLELP